MEQSNRGKREKYPLHKLCIVRKVHALPKAAELGEHLRPPLRLG